MSRSAISLLPLILALPGCSLLSALEGEPARDLYELRVPTSSGGQCRHGRIAELVVEKPKARGTLDSDRIMIRPTVLQAEYLPDATWGDPVPVMLQGLLVEALNRYDVFTHVGREPLGLGGDYALISEIHDFNAGVTETGALIQLSVEAQLVDEMTAKVVSRGRFATSVEAPGTKTSELIPAFDLATRQLVAQMVDWTLRGVGVNPARCE